MSRRLSYAYYPGCSGTGTSIEYDKATRAVCRALNIELVDVPDWSCCGSTPAHTLDHVLSAALAARNLTMVEGMGLDTVITPCPSCLTNLKTAKHRMEKEGFRNKVGKLLEGGCGARVVAKSVLQILVEDLGVEAVRDKVRSPLTGLRIAPYYGCIMNRPPELMRFDDHEHPMSMDNLMSAIGAEVAPFPLKVECCGASYGVTRKNIVTRLSGKLLAAARDVGASAMVTACPMCQMNLDLRQDQINYSNKTTFRMPIFYYPQLIGLALGLNGKELGLDKLCVSPNALLRSMKAEAVAASA